jgi:7,8-dihydroneopterin aldolase/epimerase/oxygenase
MKDRIRIEGIEFYGFHGVTPAEREVGHRFRVDLELELDLRPAGLADDLTLTVDYAAAARAVTGIGTGPSVHLVETLAERMAASLLREFPSVEAVELWVAKVQPPVPLPFAASVIHILRRR